MTITEQLFPLAVATAPEADRRNSLAQALHRHEASPYHGAWALFDGW